MLTRALFVCACVFTCDSITYNSDTCDYLELPRITCDSWIGTKVSEGVVETGVCQAIVKRTVSYHRLHTYWKLMIRSAMASTRIRDIWWYGLKVFRSHM